MSMSPASLQDFGHPQSTILKKLQDFTCRQCRLFEEYLAVIEQEVTALGQQDLDKLAVYISRETSLVKRIQSLQKAIFPLEDLLAAIPGREEEADNRATLEQQKATLAELQAGTLSGINKIRQELHSQAALLDRQWQNRKKRIPSRPVFAGPAAPAFIDLCR